MGLLSVGISQGVDTHSMLAEIMAKVADLAKSVGRIEAELRGRGAKDKGNRCGWGHIYCISIDTKPCCTQ